MKRLTRFVCVLAFSGFVAAQEPAPERAKLSKAESPARPNVVLILADDLSPGDVQALGGASSKIPTPHLDRLAREGLRCTDAHSPSAVCTPTRYGLLTGRYAWRTPLQESVLFGFDPPLLPAERKTLGGLFQQHGYRTACIGKWHLGWTWMKGEGQPLRDPREALLIDWSLPTPDGPTTRGFDEFFGIHGTLDMAPFTYVEGNRATKPCTVIKRFGRSGPAAEDFEAELVLDHLLARSTRFLEERALAKEQPFFLLASLTSPHTPIVPARRFRGKSGLGLYGDFVLETDAWVGALLAKLAELELAENTLVIFTADNGTSPSANLPALRSRGHDPIGGWRGFKADLYEGGHRVPFLARWPGVIEAGRSSDALLCLTDFVATFAELFGTELAPDFGEDSRSFLGVLRGTSEKSDRAELVMHSFDGSFAIREGRWKLLLCAGSGGWSEPEPGTSEEARLPPRQLFDLVADPRERRNLAAEHPEIVARLEALLAAHVKRGRSTPGPEQANEVAVETAPPREKPRGK
jgi:arylsulfatase A